MTNTFENTPKEGFLKTFREQHPQKAILEKFWVLPLIHVMNSDPSIPNSYGLTKLHKFGQISQFRPNFTIFCFFFLQQERHWRGAPNDWIQTKTSPTNQRGVLTWTYKACKVLTGSWGCGCIPGSVGLAVKRWGNISSLDERIWNKGKNETWEFVWGSHILDYFWEGKNFRCSDICNTFIWWQLCFWVKKNMSEELVKASKTWN